MTTKTPSLAKAAALATFLMCLSAGFTNAQNVFLDFGQTLTPSNSTTYWNNYWTNTFLNLANSQGTATAYFFTPNVGGGINTNFITGSPNLTNLGVFNDPTVYSDAINTGSPLFDENHPGFSEFSIPYRAKLMEAPDKYDQLRSELTSIIGPAIFDEVRKAGIPYGEAAKYVEGLTGAILGAKPETGGFLGQLMPFR